MKRHWLHGGMIVVLLALFVGTPLAIPADSAAASQTAATPQVRLAVIIVVDQFRGDLINRYGRWFGKDGFNRLIKEGAFFPNAYYSYATTVTTVGHATIGTGRLPRQHGIVSSNFFTDPKSNKPQHAVQDDDVQTVGTADGPTDGQKAGSFSPRYLIGSSIGDQLKLADRRSRVFSVSAKPRSAILLAGQNPDGVFWWDQNSGKFHTSTWYAKQLPAYVADYNNSNYTDQFLDKTWELLLPEAAYAGCYPVDSKGTPYDRGATQAFPHKITKAKGKPYSSIYNSPFGNEVVLEIAKRIVLDEKLGKGPASDLLCVSFSSNDCVGHNFGPNSAELMDMTIRTDAQVASLLALLDKQVGLDHCMVVLTGDHGIKEIPELVQQMRLGAQRLDVKKITKDLNEYLTEKAGRLGEGKNYVLSIDLPWLWFDNSFAEWTIDKQMQIMYASADYLNTVPGIATVFTAAELEEPPPLPEDTARWLAWRSYCPGRSGQLYLSLEPYWNPGMGGGAGHGSDQTEDRHVPILLLGKGIRQGRYMRQVDPLDIAPTLAAGLGIEPPNNFAGHVLPEAFAEK